ncbi:flagella basal body P-ring formation protein FlgA [Dyella tabacisoli]|nr:flagella basal body P-ring formation protein FlgA [Dyella tabacisoli]
MFVVLPLQAAAGSTQQQIAAVRMVEAARAQIAERLGADGSAADVTVIGVPEDVAVPMGAVTLSAHALTGHWPRARAGVSVDVRVDGRVVRTTTVWFALSVHRAVLAYQNDLPIGASGASIKLVSRDEDIAAIQGDVIGSEQEIDGLRLRHPMVAGSVAMRADFERIPEVDRRQRVMVMASYGAVHLQTKGTASGMGYTGDVVPVLVDGAEAPVRARITDKGVVEVVQ